MPFYKAGDGFITAPKIPLKISLRQLAKTIRCFLHYRFTTGLCKRYLDKKDILNLYLKQKCADVFVTKIQNTTISQVVTTIVIDREEKIFVQQKQNLVSLAHDITKYWQKYKDVAVTHH